MPDKTIHAIDFNSRQFYRDKTIAEDVAFQKACLAARKAGLEKFTIGIDSRPCTEGRFVHFDMQPRVSLIRSSAEICAESALRDEMPQQIIGRVRT